MITFAIVGTGWRSHFFLRIARALPDRFKVTAVVSRTPKKAKSLNDMYGVKLVPSLDDALTTHPLFVVTSVPRSVNPGLLHELVGRNIPALSETPPGATVEDMVGLYDHVKGGAKIQVAEQYHLQPHHAARLTFAQTGKLGRISQTQVSAAHSYHGLSLIRRFLGITFENPILTATTFTSPLVKGPNRDGPPTEETLFESSQLIAWLDFGDRLGIFDFTDDQYFSHIRNQRLLIRGDRGEIINHTATILQDFLTPIHITFTRHDAGPEGNLEGHYLKGYQANGEWVYQNPLAPGELSDDEIAVGVCLLKMADYVDGGPDFYSLAEACQDHYLGILIQQAQETGQPVTAETQPWAL